MVADFTEDVSKPGAPRGHGRSADQTYLAEALGITIEELELAQQAANEKAIDLAVEDGVLTKEQADAMKTLGIGMHGFHSMPRVPSRIAGKIDHETLLAEELGITVEELQAAHETAKEAEIQNAVEKGDLSQEQAELMKARQALMAYHLDHESIIAQVLGISVEELQAAQEEGLQIKDA